mgnify:CR=1 FL=1|jgi:hypothetical protein
MSAPAIRDLNALISEIGQSVAPQKQLIDADIANAQKAGDAQIAGMEARKDKTFGQIEQRASDKGMLFSGFSPDAQAEYTASTYLPALAALQEKIAATRSQLLGKKADLDTNVFEKAYQTREGDIGRRFTYDEGERSRAFQAAENEKRRAFEADQNERNRQSQAALQRAQIAASRAAASGNVPDIKRAIQRFLDPLRGGDKKVSPRNFKRGLEMWMGAGGAPASYYRTFQNYVNMSHSQDYF